MTFQEKCFSSYILLTDQISLPNRLYFSRYWAICVLQLLTRLRRHKIRNLIFLIKLLLSFFCYMTKKSRQKLKNLENEKRWNKKHFSSFLKGFQLPKIVSDLRVHLWGYCLILFYRVLFNTAWIWVMVAGFKLTLKFHFFLY